MKINTDGVILGALSVFSWSGSQGRVLDVGTGTGVIAMMLAQRFETAQIDAIDFDKSAAEAAGRNFSFSPYADRLSVVFGDIASYSAVNGYDMIVSNPPFFVNDLKNPEKRKSMARHAGDDFFETLVCKSAELLSENGVLWLILPVKQADLVVELGVLQGLHLVKVISIHSDVSKPVIRKVICLGKVSGVVELETFYIYEAEKVYTEGYRKLLKDFFLAF